MTRGAKSAVMPLVLLWLLAHAVLLALILGAKFLFTKAAVMAMLVVAGLAFLFVRFRRPQKLLTAP